MFFYVRMRMFYDTAVCLFKVLNWIIDCKMIDVYIAYRLLLTIPLSNCESERSFSALKRNKDMLSSTMGDYIFVSKVEY